MAKKNRITHLPPVAVLMLGYWRGRILSMGLQVFLAFAAAMPVEASQLAGSAADRPVASRQIVLFGAHWCAPCMVEYRSLPQIVAAAAPHRVILAWIDEPIAVPAALAGKVDTLPAREAQSLAQRMLGEGYGLPSVAVLDAKGRACSIRRAPLREQDVQVVLKQCADSGRP